MLVLRLTVFCLLFCGSFGFGKYFSVWFKNCNAPQTLIGKFCAALFDNDVDGDGDVDTNDFNYDLITYNDDENLCESTQAEVVERWTCRYGYSKNYARFMFKRFDGNNNGVVSNADIAGPVFFSNENFLQLQYNRFKTAYCGLPENRENELDRVLCAEVDALKPEDVKCG